MPRVRRRGHRLRERLTADDVISMLITAWDPGYSAEDLEQLRERAGEAAFQGFMDEKRNFTYDERTKQWTRTGKLKLKS